MLLVLGWFMVLEPGEQPAKEGFDLVPEELECNQSGKQATNDCLKHNAARAWVDVEVSFSRQVQKE
jgi:hypothetical protein